MKVVALTGEKHAYARLLKALSDEGTVAIISYGADEGRVFSGEMPQRVLRVKSPLSYALYVGISNSYKYDVIRALDRLAEQGDTDFAVVIGNGLATEIASLREVYTARLEVSTNVNAHLQSLATLPEWITLDSLVQAVRLHPDSDKAGAILTFTGVVRGEAVALDFDIYDEKAQQQIDSIIRDLTGRVGIIDVKIHHKAGRIERGEDIVYIVVEAAHREEGFKALRDAIERLKAEVPIWKKELKEHSAKWVNVVQL
ncbi:MAG: molybdenum cofactor biosynthesis protein MoaE [Halobacteriota archaeon]